MDIGGASVSGTTTLKKEICVKMSNWSIMQKESRMWFKIVNWLCFLIVFLGFFFHNYNFKILKEILLQKDSKNQVTNFVLKVWLPVTIFN